MDTVKPPSPPRDDLRSLLILAAFALVFFHPLILQPSQMIFSPLSDLVGQTYGWKHFIRQTLWGEGQLPFWNPWLMCGYPILGNLNCALLFPMHLLFLILPAGMAASWTYFLAFLLGGAGAYFYLRVIGIRPWGALLGALAYGFGVRNLGHVVNGFVGHLETLPFLPASFAFATLVARHRRWRWAAGLAAVLAVILLSAFAQIFLYLMFILPVYFAWLLWAGEEGTASRRSGEGTPEGVADRSGEGRSRDQPGAAEEEAPAAGGRERERASTPAVRQRSRLLAAIQFLSAIALAAGLAAVHLLPSLELLPELSRSGEMAASLYRLGSLPPRHYFTLLDPELLGRPLPEWSYFGASYFWTLSCYVPALLLPLAALSLTRPEGRRYRNFFLALIPFLFLFAMGPHTPVYGLFHRFLPGVRLFREPARILFFFPLAMAALAGLGWNALREQGGTGSQAGARPRGGDAEGGKGAETGATERSRAAGRPAEGGPAGVTDKEADERESAAGAGGSACGSNAGRQASQPAAADSGWPKRATATLGILLVLLVLLAAGAAIFVSGSAGLREAAFQRSAAFFIGRAEVASRAARQYEESWQRGLPLSAGAALVLFGGSFALCLAAVRWGKALPVRTLRGAALLLVAADLLFFGRGYLATRPATLLFDPGGPLASHLAALARREPPCRVADLCGALPDCLAEVAGLEKVGGYDPINLAATQRYFNALNGRGDEGGPAWTLAVEPGFDRRLLDLLGARYVVSREPLSLERLFLERTLENVPATLMNYGPILFPRVYLYRNEQSFPRAWFVERAQRLDLQAPLAGQLAAVDLERVVLIEERGARGGGRGAGAGAEAKGQEAETEGYAGRSGGEGSRGGAEGHASQAQSGEQGESLVEGATPQGLAASREADQGAGPDESGPAGPGAASVEDALSRDLIQVQRAGPDRLRLEGDCPAAGFVVLSQAWASGWRAREEGSGREVRLLRADGMLTAIPVAAGRISLELNYRPRTYRAGLVLSLVSLALLLTIVVLDRRARPWSGRPVHRPGSISR